MPVQEERRWSANDGSEPPLRKTLKIQLILRFNEDLRACCWGGVQKLQQDAQTHGSGPAALAT